MFKRFWKIVKHKRFHHNTNQTCDNNGTFWAAISAISSFAATAFTLFTSKDLTQFQEKLLDTQKKIAEIQSKNHLWKALNNHYVSYSDIKDKEVKSVILSIKVKLSVDESQVINELLKKKYSLDTR